MDWSMYAYIAAWTALVAGGSYYSAAQHLVPKVVTMTLNELEKDGLIKIVLDKNGVMEVERYDHEV
jgi:hypothetical protein